MGMFEDLKKYATASHWYDHIYNVCLEMGVDMLLFQITSYMLHLSVGNYNASCYLWCKATVLTKLLSFM